jgi:hypothetical protein
VQQPYRWGVVAAAAMMGWLTLVLAVDSSASLTVQRLLGLATGGVLLLAMSRFSRLVRAQTVVVVAFATVVEHVFSPGLEVYVYRFDNVPAYVPPGHGLVYLSAFALGHAPVVRRHLRLAVAVAVMGLGAWTAHGLWLAERSDALGAVWFGCLVAFLRWGPSTEVYVGAAVVVTWLELLGTELGTWTWQEEDPVGWLTIGNPPTGAAGGYGWFDLAALLTAPALLAAWSRVTGRSGEPDVRGRAAGAPGRTAAQEPPALPASSAEH